MEDMSSKKNNNKMEEENSKSKTRVKSLDTFRGITIALMIFVNDGAGGMYIFFWNNTILKNRIVSRVFMSRNRIEININPFTKNILMCCD